MDRLLPNGQPPKHEPGCGRNKFTKKEDEKLLKLINNEIKNSNRRSNIRKNDGSQEVNIGHAHLINWRAISVAMKTRTPRQCRERYQNYLSPDITNAEWTEEDDNLIKQLFEKYGNKWNKISKFFNGRTGNAIRNRYQVILRKEAKLLRRENNTKSFSPAPEVLSDTEKSDQQDSETLEDFSANSVPLLNSQQSTLDNQFNLIFQKIFEGEDGIFGPKNLELFEDPFF